MGLFDPKSSQQQSEGAAPTAIAPPPPTSAPVGSKPKANKSTPSFLGVSATPDATQRSDKTLLGQ